MARGGYPWIWCERDEVLRTTIESEGMLSVQVSLVRQL